MKIIYTGGGTMGSVSPLIAIHQSLKSYKRQATNYKSLWIGTKDGIEKEVVEKEGIKFQAIASGKLRRYFDLASLLHNLIDILKIFVGWWQAYFIIFKFSPDVVVSAGGFVAVPVVWAGWVLGVPCIIHQQDVEVGLANKLMAPVAKKITVALEKSLQDFSSKKIVLVGNPVRLNNKIQKINDKQIQNSKFQFKNDLPTILVMGGGTGAQVINNLVWESLDELTKFCNVAHLTGKNKNIKIQEYKNNKKYIVNDFLNKDELYVIYENSDLVISRAGMSALTELAYFSKSTIIIPMPDSHQEKNAEYFSEKEAGIYLKQNELNEVKLVKQVKQVFEDMELQEKLSKNMNKVFVDYSGEKIIEIIKKLIKN